MSLRSTAALVLLLATAGACADADGREMPNARAEAAPDARENATPDNEGVTVRGVAGHYDLGDYFIEGEVVNELDVPIYDVELAVTFRDAAGAELASDQAAVVLSRIPPGGTAPFVKTHYGAPEGIKGHTVTVRGFSRESRLRYRDLAVSNVSTRRGITGTIVSGQVRNDSGVPLTGVKLVAWFRNSAGEVTGVFFDYPVLGGMAPGRSVDFTIETMVDEIAGDSVTVRGEGTAGTT